MSFLLQMVLCIIRVKVFRTCTTKAYGRSRCIAPIILNLCTIWWSVVSVMPQPLYPWGTRAHSTNVIGSYVRPRVSLGHFEEKNLLLIWGFENIVQPVAESLY